VDELAQVLPMCMVMAVPKRRRGWNSLTPELK